MVDFVNRYKDCQEPGGLRLGVEPVCVVLSAHGVKIASSAYYEWCDRLTSSQQHRDEQLQTEISRVYDQNFQVYRARKIWLQLNREGILVARCTVERLMRRMGIQGVSRGKT